MHYYRQRATVVQQILHRVHMHYYHQRASNSCEADLPSSSHALLPPEGDQGRDRLTENSAHSHSHRLGTNFEAV